MKITALTAAPMMSVCATAMRQRRAASHIRVTSTSPTIAARDEAVVPSISRLAAAGRSQSFTWVFS